MLGPLLFSAFTAPIAPLITSFGLKHQQYADDTLIHGSIPTVNYLPSLRQIESCLSSLCIWFAQNGLSVNPKKSDAIIFGTQQRLTKLKTAGLTSLTVFNSVIPISPTLTLLGVTLDSTLSFDSHCRHVLKSSLYHLRSIRHIRPLLSQSDAQLVATCFVQSRLDYANSLLANTSTTKLKRLQRIQNSLARVTVNAPFPKPSEELLSELHWLPVESRISYKLASITHSVLNLRQPSTLLPSLIPYTPSRSLRSSYTHLLTVPRTHLALTSRSFSVAAPIIWNSLPPQLRTITPHPLFCKHLKTELFKAAHATSCA